VENNINELMLDKLNQILAKRSELESEYTDQIATAFAAAQLEYPPYIGPNRDGFFLKSQFTDIAALRTALFPVLAKHGLSFRQYTKRQQDGSLTLISTLSHSSGQFFSSSDTITPENALLRSYGDACKYIRRHQMMALLQCDPFLDENDNDGERQNKEFADTPLQKQKLDAVDLNRHSYMTISPDQIDQIELELDGWPDLARSFFKTYEIQRVADLRRSMFDDAFKQILRIKAEMKKGKN